MDDSNKIIEQPMNGQTVISQLFEREWIRGFDEEFFEGVAALALDELNYTMSNLNAEPDIGSSLRVIAYIQVLFLISEHSRCTKELLEKLGWATAHSLELLNPEIGILQYLLKCSLIH